MVEKVLEAKTRRVATGLESGGLEKLAGIESMEVLRRRQHEDYLGPTGARRDIHARRVAGGPGNRQVDLWWRLW